MENYINMLKETEYDIEILNNVIKNAQNKIEMKKNKKNFLIALINYKKQLSKLFNNNGKILESEYESSAMILNDCIYALIDEICKLE
jgi:hypothetical protein